MFRPALPTRHALALALVLGILAGCSGGRSSNPAGGPVPSPRGVPTGAPISRAAIGPGGGSVTSGDGLLTVTVPADAVAADVEFTIVELTNTAPGGVGSAYRLGPAGLVPAAPITLTFTVPPAVTTAVDALAISTQGEGSGAAYWVRTAGAARDAIARTLSTPVDHFSDWALVTATTDRDLTGPITVTSTLDIPFSATGTATLSHAGGDDALAYYLASGTLTLVQPLAWDGGSCTSPSPLWPLRTNVATLAAAAADLEYGVSGFWDLECTGGATATTTTSFAIDTVGVSNPGCARAWAGTPVLTADRISGTFEVDCGAAGFAQVTLDLQSCGSGGACDLPPASHTP